MSRIALAALLACSTLVGAAPAVAQDRITPRSPEYRVRIDDLNLSSANGAARFDQRLQRTVRSACSGRPTLSGLQCRDSLSRALRDALPSAQREDYARVRSSRVLAMVPTFPS